MPGGQEVWACRVQVALDTQNVVSPMVMDSTIQKVLGPTVVVSIVQKVVSFTAGAGG